MAIADATVTGETPISADIFKQSMRLLAGGVCICTTAMNGERLGLTMTAAREWGKFNIRANSICFGVVETPMTEVVRGDKFRDGILAQIPMGRWAQPEEVVKTVCFLLSDASSYTTGQHLGVNGGFHVSV